jgi:deoxyribonuclease IV
MPLFGAHLSIAGGLHKAVEAAAALGMETVQIFTHSPSQWAVKPVIPAGKESLRDGKSLTKNANQWAAKPLLDADVATFRIAVSSAKLKHVTAHDSYLINLAAPDDGLYRKSIAAFVDEVERAETLGLSYLVTHPGAHTGSGVEAGIARVVQALDEVLTRCAGFRVKVLLETTAGQGTCLGATFEELAAMLDRVKDAARLGVCLDTCHVFAAGYAIHTEVGYAAMFDEFDDRIGFAKLKLFHLNDSVKGVGCRVDRHAGIGLGQIGVEAFRWLVNDPRFAKRPMILETPKEDAEGNPMDPVNLARLRELCGEISERPARRTATASAANGAKAASPESRRIADAGRSPTSGTSRPA